MYKTGVRACARKEDMHTELKPHITYAIPRELQPPPAHHPTSATVPIDGQRVLPVCFACHKDYPLPEDERILGLLLDTSYLSLDEAIKHMLEHQRWHRESAHGQIIDRVDHTLIVYNAGIIFERSYVAK